MISEFISDNDNFEYGYPFLKNTVKLCSMLQLLQDILGKFMMLSNQTSCYICKCISHSSLWFDIIIFGWYIVVISRVHRLEFTNSDVMFCLQSYHEGLRIDRIDRSLVY